MNWRRRKNVADLQKAIVLAASIGLALILRLFVRRFPSGDSSQQGLEMMNAERSAAETSWILCGLATSQPGYSPFPVRR